MTREELVGILEQRKTELAAFFDQREDIKHVVKIAVGPNTFRAFAHTPRKPSDVFREWAFKQLNDGSFIKKLHSISSQGEYDDWLSELSENLSSYWAKEMGKPMPYGPSRKLTNLLMKRVALWKELNDAQRQRLIRFLHVPPDEFSLGAIGECIYDFPEGKLIGKIPNEPSMGFVKTEEMYNALQKIYRRICEEADVPAIYFDVLSWDKRGFKK